MMVNKMDRGLNGLMNRTETDSYNFGDDSSSDEEAKSSDDDIDDALNGCRENDSDSFEKEMEIELNKEFIEHRKRYWESTTEKENTKDAGSLDNEPDKGNLYDNDYFSSGSEDEDNVGGILSKSKQRRTVQTDDELLYDPNMDEENENWMTKQRKGYQNIATADISVDKTDSAAMKPKTAAPIKPTCTKSANSDAILSCPACLTTLCIDCQRHDIYKQQFRAMFVMNCNIISDETLRYEAKKDKKKAGKKKQNQQEGASTSSVEAPDELFNPVQCALCNTEVAVYDKEELYHFFNVVESLS